MEKIRERKNEFNENMEILKRTYADMKIKMKNNSTKKSVGRLTNYADHIEDKISGLEDK